MTSCNAQHRSRAGNWRSTLGVYGHLGFAFRNDGSFVFQLFFLEFLGVSERFLLFELDVVCVSIGLSRGFTRTVQDGLEDTTRLNAWNRGCSHTVTITGCYD